LFSYYQQHHFRRFDGASVIFGLLLGISTVGSMLVWLAFLIYYGFRVVWWAPFALLGLDLLLFPFGLLIARLITPFGMSMLGFLALPVLAYFMFRLTPNVI
jgi:hypothetical protein